MFQIKTFFFSIFMIVNLCFICSMKSFWFDITSIIFIFFEKKTTFWTFDVDWEKNDFDSKINHIDIWLQIEFLRFRTICQIFRMWNLRTALYVIFVKTLYRWYIDKIKKIICIIDELLLESYKDIRNQSNCKNYDEIVTINSMNKI